MDESEFADKYFKAIEAQRQLVALRAEAESCFTIYRDFDSDEFFTEFANETINYPNTIAHFIIKNFEMDISCIYDDNCRKSDNSGERNGSYFVPTLTFGDIWLPMKLINKHDPFDQRNILRKYILLSEHSSGEKIFELLTKHWKFQSPKLVLSFTSGNIEEFEGNEKLFKTFVSNLYRFCKSTGVWILSHGFHCGVTRLLGRIFEYDLEPKGARKNSSLQKDVTLIGICDWDKLQDQTLLHGISPDPNYSSCYFFPSENNLEAFEEDGTLSPFLHLHLLAQGSGIATETALQLALEQHFQREPDQTGGKHAIPIVKFLLGDESTSLKQIRTCVEAKIPVVIVPQSGKIPNCLAEIYKELEFVTTRSWDHKPGLKEEEKLRLEEILNHEACSVFDEQDVEDIKETLEVIMKHRYFLTILNLTNQRSADFTNVISAIYKPKESVDCMNIALQTDSVSFLKTFLSRDVDVSLVKGFKFVDAHGLVSLHRRNLIEKAELFEIDRNDILNTENEKILQKVGVTVSNLMGYKYCRLYQENISSLERDSVQFWHMFVYTVLSNRGKFAECLLSHTESPIGAALFACKLFRSMHRNAKRQMETETALRCEQSANVFEDLALKLLHQIYQESPQSAYICLTSELPYELGVNVTPLSLATDSHSMRFMESECCQTYLQKVWTKNMYLAPRMKNVLPVLIMLPFLPPAMIHFQEFKTPANTAHVCEESGKRWKLCWSQQSCRKPNSWLWKVRSFYTAPITKCNFSMISYLTFLGVLSYFFMAKLQPVNAASEIFPSEWLCYVWVLGFVFEEAEQIFYIKGKEPSLPDIHLRAILQNFSLQIYNKVKLYLQFWGNILDFMLIVFFCITTVCRFTLPTESFQMVRNLYSFSVIFFYFRTLRYFYMLKVIGPRIMAMYMMLKETLLFILILWVFVIGFGVAFQGLLNPLQSPSWVVLGDILWRSYWPMFGHLYIDDEDSVGMGRDVGNNTCMKAIVSGEEGDTSCFSFVPTVLLAVYLFISNILLLNLLIAIFGNTLNNIESSSNTHWAFNQYEIIYEYYYKSWLPAPLNIPWHLWQIIWNGFCCVFKKLRSQSLNDDPVETCGQPLFLMNEVDGNDLQTSIDEMIQDLQERWRMRRSLAPNSRQWCFAHTNELANDHFWTQNELVKEENLQLLQQETVRKLQDKAK